MAEIFDASGVAQGEDFARALTSTLEAFRNTAEQLTGAADDLSGSANDLDKATESLKGLGVKAAGPNAALPVARRIPVAHPLAPGPGASGGSPAGSVVPPAGGIQANHYLAIIAQNTTALVHLSMGIGLNQNTTAGIGKALGASSGGAGAAVGIAATLGPLVAIVTALAVDAKLAGEALEFLVKTAHNFVEAVNPAVVQNFDMAMRDLNAVVGTLLVPVLAEATRLVRDFASYLYPIVQQVLPSFREGVGAVSQILGALLPIAANVVGAFAGLFPIMAELAKLFADLVMPSLRAFAAIAAGVGVAVKTVLNAILGLFGGDLRNKVKSFGEMLGLTTLAMAGLAFQLLGMTAAVNGMLADLKAGPAKQDATGLAVAQNARFSDPGSLGKELAQRAFVTTGREQGAEKQDEMARFRALGIAVLEDIKNGGFGDKLAEKLANEILRILMILKNEAGNRAKEALNELNPFNGGNGIANIANPGGWLLNKVLEEIL